MSDDEDSNQIPNEANDENSNENRKQQQNNGSSPSPNKKEEKKTTTTIPPLLVSKSESVPKQYKEKVVHFMQGKLDQFFEDSNSDVSSKEIAEEIYQALLEDNTILKRKEIRFWHVAVNSQAVVCPRNSHVITFRKGKITVFIWQSAELNEVHRQSQLPYFDRGSNGSDFSEENIDKLVRIEHHNQLSRIRSVPTLTEDQKQSFEESLKHTIRIKAVTEKAHYVQIRLQQQFPDENWHCVAGPTDFACLSGDRTRSGEALVFDLSEMMRRQKQMEEAAYLRNNMKQDSLNSLDSFKSAISTFTSDQTDEEENSPSIPMVPPIKFLIFTHQLPKPEQENMDESTPLLKRSSSVGINGDLESNHHKGKDKDSEKTSKIWLLAFCLGLISYVGLCVWSIVMAVLHLVHHDYLLNTLDGDLMIGWIAQASLLVTSMMLLSIPKFQGLCWSAFITIQMLGNVGFSIALGLLLGWQMPFILFGTLNCGIMIGMIIWAIYEWCRRPNQIARNAKIRQLQRTAIQ